MDHVSAERRSVIMAKVPSRDTRPELQVRRLLHRAGYRFRLHRSDLPGSPDIVLPKHRLAVFVNGCFWHGHERCSKARLPRTRTTYWRRKISTNRRRDRRVLQELDQLGWTTTVIWQCEIKDESRLMESLEIFINLKNEDVGA